jgi:hypothetical protein
MALGNYLGVKINMEYETGKETSDPGSINK